MVLLVLCAVGVALGLGLIYLRRRRRRKVGAMVKDRHHLDQGIPFFSFIPHKIPACLLTFNILAVQSLAYHIAQEIHCNLLLLV